MRHVSMKRQAGGTLPRLLGLVLIGFGLAILLIGAYLVWNSLKARMALEDAADAVRQQVEQIERRIASLQAAISSGEFVDIATEQDGQINRDALLAVLRNQDVGNVLNIVVARQ